MKKPSATTLAAVAKWRGSLGGKARARNLTAAELSAAGKKAAEARWIKLRKEKP